MRGTSKENRGGFGPADFISADGTVRGYVSKWCDDNSVICDVYNNITDELEESAAKIPLEELKNVNWCIKTYKEKGRIVNKSIEGRLQSNRILSREDTSAGNLPW